MDDEKRQYHKLDLPEEFWVDLLQVRNYLIDDVRFSAFVYAPTNRDHPFVKAFQHISCWLDRTILDLYEDELKLIEH